MVLLSAKLPLELVEQIFKYVPYEQHLACRLINRAFDRFLTDPAHLRAVLRLSLTNTPAYSQLDEATKDGSNIQDRGFWMRVFYDAEAWVHCADRWRKMNPSYRIQIKILDPHGAANSPLNGFTVGTYDDWHWDRYLRIDDEDQLYHRHDKEWSYDKNFVVFFDPRCRLMVHELKTNRQALVPLRLVQHCRIRSVRINDQMIAVEYSLASSVTVDPQWHYNLTVAFFRVNESTPSTNLNVTVWCQIVVPSAGYENKFRGNSENAVVWYSAHTSQTYALYTWNDMEEASKDPKESLTVWRLAYGPEEPPIVSARTNEKLEHLGILQGRVPQLYSLKLDDANVFFIENRSNVLQGLHTTRSGSLPIHPIGGARPKFEQRVTAVPTTHFGPPMLQDWFDASQYHTGKEMFMQRIGTRIKRSRHGNFHVDSDMLDNHGGIGVIMYDPEHSRSTWCDVNVMGQRIRMPQGIRDETNTTVKYGGDDKWLVGRGLDSELDNGDGDSDHLTCFYFGDSSDISEIPGTSLVSV
ncbi:MAG: hypothetical protein Q9197_003298 [Variospora fuerteventurae]